MGGAFSGESAWRRSRIVLPVSSPAAGADWSVTVPAGHVYSVLAIQARLVTSAAVANRDPHLIVGDGVRTFLVVPEVAVIAASLTRDLAWFPFAAAQAVGGNQGIPIPDLVIPAGWTFGTSTGAIDVADQWSGIYVWLIDTTVRDGAVDLDGLPDLFVQVVEPGPVG